MTGDRAIRRLTAAAVLLVADVAALGAAPLVAEFALRHGEPGWLGWLYPAMTSGMVVASSLVIVHERLSGRREPWWAWLALAVTFALTMLLAVVQVAS